MASRRPDKDLVDAVVREYRVSGNQDRAFDKLAADVLGINETDLHCVNIIENSQGLSAGELAAQAGLTSGAITGVIDRLERAGYARRVPDPRDRRRVIVEVTPEFYDQAGRIWGPLASEWQAVLQKRFPPAELELIVGFLQVTNEVGARHMRRLAEGQL
jgi:DNA-binding MarR family transcriptional regulator